MTFLQKVRETLLTSVKMFFCILSLYIIFYTFYIFIIIMLKLLFDKAYLYIII